MQNAIVDIQNGVDSSEVKGKYVLNMQKWFCLVHTGLRELSDFYKEQNNQTSLDSIANSFDFSSWQENAKKLKSLNVHFVLNKNLCDSNK